MAFRLLALTLDDDDDLWDQITGRRVKRTSA